MLSHPGSSIFSLTLDEGLTSAGEGPIMEELMTVVEAAEKLSVSPRTVQRYCKHGLLNHKWIHGKRHKELRVVPPIPLSLLPGVKHGSAPDLGDLVSKKELEEIISTFKRELSDRDNRIDILEKELSKFAPLPNEPEGQKTVLAASADPNLRRKMESFLNEFEQVRPLEKQLIIKLAHELQSHSKFLRTLGFEKDKDEV
ncbi:MAG: helix-turn-helix domain-containing protein [Candidatus Latescibacterota bacterium]